MSAATVGTDTGTRLKISGTGWGKHIPMSPEEACCILSKDLPAGTEINIDISESGCGFIAMQAEGFFKDSCNPDKMRKFNLKEKTLEEGRVEVNQEKQNARIGRILLRNRIEFFYLCGVRRLNICATLSAGGYTWARAGFEPDDVTSKAFKVNVKNIVQGRYQALRLFLGPYIRGILDEATQFKHPHDIWTIADLQSVLPPRLKTMFNKFAFGTDTMNAMEKQVEWALDCMNCDMGRIKKLLEDGRDLPIGAILLPGTTWSGHIDMNNIRQARRVEKYVGGWNHISVHTPAVRSSNLLDFKR